MGMAGQKGIYASVLNALGLLDGLATLADMANDPMGRTRGGAVASQARAPAEGRELTF